MSSDFTTVRIRIQNIIRNTFKEIRDWDSKSQKGPDIWNKDSKRTYTNEKYNRWKIKTQN